MGGFGRRESEIAGCVKVSEVVNRALKCFSRHINNYNSSLYSIALTQCHVMSDNPKRGRLSHQWVKFCRHGPGSMVGQNRAIFFHEQEIECYLCYKDVCR